MGDDRPRLVDVYVSARRALRCAGHRLLLVSVVLTLLSVAISQLLWNAVESTATDSRPPEVSASRGSDGVALIVRDWGGGLPTTNPKLLIRLLHSTKPGHRGLGLITAERVARLHGGTLTFESPKDGAQVTLRLPRI